MTGDFWYDRNASQQQDEVEDAKFRGYVANISAAQSANQNDMQQLDGQNSIQAGQITPLHQQIVVTMN